MLRRGFKIPELDDDEEDIILPDPYLDEEL